MAEVKINNNAASRLASSIAAGAGSLAVTSGEGGKFPSPTAGDWFPITVLKASGQLEVMRCTARTADVLTVSRGQEGTSAIAFDAGDRVELRATAAVFAELQTKTADALTAANAAQADANAAQADADLGVKKDATTTTGAAKLPSGTVAQRPGTPSVGMFRHNSDINEHERYQGGAWVPLNVADKAFNEAPIVTIASASTVNIGAAAANTVSISGSVTIVGFDTIAAGARRTLVFQGAPTLTHNGTSLILPGAASITAAAGDVAEFVSLGSGNWRCTSYIRAANSLDGLGFNQTHQDVAGSRALATNYTNTTNQPIDVEVLLSSTSSGQVSITATVGGVSLGAVNYPVTAAGFVLPRKFIVPPGKTYRIDTTGSSATPTISKWMELRA